MATPTKGIDADERQLARNLITAHGADNVPIIARVYAAQVLREQAQKIINMARHEMEFGRRHRTAVDSRRTAIYVAGAAAEFYKQATTQDGADHVDYVCPGDHDDGGWSCQFCAGGLSACTECGSFEGATTTDCPGEKMTEARRDAVYAGRLDYLGGEWVEGRCSIIAPGWFNWAIGEVS